MRKWRRAISLEELCSKSLIHSGYFLQILAFSRQGHNPKLSVDDRQTRSLPGPGIAISLNKRNVLALISTASYMWRKHLRIISDKRSRQRFQHGGEESNNCVLSPLLPILSWKGESSDESR